MVVRELWIAGSTQFSGVSWRAALVFFLEQKNRAGSDVRTWPKILFSCDEGHSLTFGCYEDRYYAFGKVQHVQHEEQMTVVDAEQCRLVERSLLRLVEVSMPVTILLRADAICLSTVTFWVDRADDLLRVSAFQVSRSFVGTQGKRGNSSTFVH